MSKRDGTIPRGNMTERERETERAAALGLWEGLSHSALLNLIVIVLKVVAAKNNWREK